MIYYSLFTFLLPKQVRSYLKEKGDEDVLKRLIDSNPDSIYYRIVIPHIQIDIANFERMRNSGKSKADMAVDYANGNNDMCNFMSDIHIYSRFYFPFHHEVDYNSLSPQNKTDFGLKRLYIDSLLDIHDSHSILL